MSRFVPHPMDAWAAERGVALLYPDGQEVREGDIVDYGEDFHGTVLRCSVATAEALVAISGSRRYPVSKLKLAGRKEEENPTT